MKTTEAEQMGIDHAKAGKMLTPHDCIEVDKLFFAAAKEQTKYSEFKEYSRLRGAFNKGWNKYVYLSS